MNLIAVALALLDFAPIFFLSLGLFFLAQLVDRLDSGCRSMSRAGLALIVIGGLSGAISNLVLALGDEAIPILTTTLYVFCAPGFTLMAAGLWRARATISGRVVRRDPWLAPSAIAWAFLLLAFYLNGSGPSESWKAALLALGIGAWAAVCFLAAALGWKRQLHMAALLFAFNLTGTVGVLALRTWIAQPWWVQLLEELLNLAAQAALAFAAWRVAAEYHANVGPTAPTSEA